MTVDIHPLFSPWGRFGLYSFFIDAPEPAIVDTGINTSPDAMAGELQKLGRRIEDVRWILLTHGHIDHIGGAQALWELTGRRADVVIHEADAPMLRSRQAHIDEYCHARGKYIADPHGAEQVAAAGRTVISGELEPTMSVRGGERLTLGSIDGEPVTVSVHSVPGHTPGSVAYVVEGQNDVFVGDAVQLHGAANGFPGYADPAAYRASLTHLRDDVRPARLFLGHPYRRDGVDSEGVVLDGERAAEALQYSLDVEAGLAEDYQRVESKITDSPYSPFEAAATAAGYSGDPTLEPSPFFTTLHGYAAQS